MIYYEFTIELTMSYCRLRHTGVCDILSIVAVFRRKTVTIANGGNLSTAADCNGLFLTGLSMPSAWTAANITFSVSANDGASFQNLYETDGTEMLWTVTVDNTYMMLPSRSLIGGITNIRVRSGTSATPVNQAAERTIILFFGGE